MFSLDHFWKTPLICWYGKANYKKLHSIWLITLGLLWVLLPYWRRKVSSFYLMISLSRKYRISIIVLMINLILLIILTTLFMDMLNLLTSKHWFILDGLLLLLYALSKDWVFGEAEYQTDQENLTKNTGRYTLSNNYH